MVENVRNLSQLNQGLRAVEVTYTLFHLDHLAWLSSYYESVSPHQCCQVAAVFGCCCCEGGGVGGCGDFASLVAVAGEAAVAAVAAAACGLSLLLAAG